MLPTPVRCRGTARAGLLAVLLAALTLGFLPGPAHAAERTVSGGRLDWGIRSSFLNYVTGPIAQGSWSLSGGAATVGSNQFRFHSASGDYDPGTGAVTARYSGGVRFYGHQDESGTYELDLTISNPAVRVSGNSGTLLVDMRSKDRDTGAVSESSGVSFATLDLSGVDLRGGTQISVSGVPATLTNEGATAFAGFYNPGDPLDPVTFTADTLDPAPDPAGTPDPDPSPSDSSDDPGEEAEEDADEAEDAREITDAAIDWGIRRTFREFVTGDIAEGGWELNDGAQDGGALFRFPDGTGEIDTDAGTLSAAFTGGLHFTGNDLDLLFETVTVEVDDGTGTLLADVTTEGETRRAQPLVTFEVPEVDAEDGLFHLVEAPAELTEEGADAFGGLYSAGTAMDPVTLAVAVDEDAELPALPDLGSEPTEEPEPDPEPEPEPAAAQEEAAEDSSSPPMPLLVTGVVALLVLAGAGYLVLRRTRAQRTTAPLADKETPEP
ncbi:MULTISPECIES: HtaA domain-containing protein [unclassified Streptomyces]|uniref:HtaA domain-containing protein n=1 Tax=unclassified Streptomyces TaxID=2593676 RepID=UPI000CD52AC3|nr:MULTISPECIES: HtaA domain-containing protein [unclassified Streptomyces]